MNLNFWIRFSIRDVVLSYWGKAVRIVIANRFSRTDIGFSYLKVCVENI